MPAPPLSKKLPQPPSAAEITSFSRPELGTDKTTTLTMLASSTPRDACTWPLTVPSPMPCVAHSPPVSSAALRTLWPTRRSAIATQDAWTPPDPELEDRGRTGPSRCG